MSKEAMSAKETLRQERRARLMRLDDQGLDSWGVGATAARSAFEGAGLALHEPARDPSPSGLTRRAALMGLGAGALNAAMPASLMMMAGAAQAQASGGYKAAVCIFLNGGADCASMLIPYEINAHASYFSSRDSIAFERAALTPFQLTGAAGAQEFGLAPGAAGLKSIFDRGRLSAVANVGPLLTPLTLAQYKSRALPAPAKLFSHNDQQSTWQSGKVEGAQPGWGGLMSDQLLSQNPTQAFSAISISGRAPYLTGESCLQLQVGSGGPVAFKSGAGSSLFGSASGPALSKAAMTETQAGLFETEAIAVNARSLSISATMISALAAVSLTTAFPATGLGNQLKMVARLIAARGALGATRQNFFVQIGGWDMHDFLLRDWPIRIAELSNAMNAFDLAMLELGLGNDVLAFTASDFGRNLASNGDGSDHGWGGHHFVVGPHGGALHGSFPSVAFKTATDVGNGALLPTTAVDQYAAGVGAHLGLSPAQISAILPNLKNFPAPLAL